MVGPNKVLTVSYGTFSCTLEGFEDSFDTMKAIAEYFRDLAADDRYFGAEPPTPDAEMLARIAEKEIARRVEAWHDRDRIVLRAERLDDAQVAERAAATAARAEAVLEKASVAKVAAEQAAADNTRAGIAEADIAEVGKAEVDKVIEPQDIATDEGVAVRATSSRAIETGNRAIEVAVGSSVPTQAPLAPDAIAQTTLDPSPQDRAAVAEKLERIRAVVARAPAKDEVKVPDAVPEALAITPAVTVPEIDDYIEDQHAEEAVSDLGAVLEERAEAIVHSEADEAVDLVSAEVWDDEAELGFDDEDLDFDAEDASEGDQPGTVSAPSVIAPRLSEDQEPVVENAAGDDDLDAILDRLMAKTRRAEPPTSQAQTDESDAKAVADAEFDAPAQKAESLRARVIKVRKVDLEQAIRAGLLEEETKADVAPQSVVSQAIVSQSPSSLSDEEEMDLARELAEVEAELGRDADGAFTFDGLDEEEEDDEPLNSLFDEEEEAEQNAEEQANATRAVVQAQTDLGEDEFEEDAFDREDHPERRSEAGQRLAGADADRDVMRLMAKTISEMDEPESTHRRSAIAHLRAAVAATKAEKQEGGVLKAEPSAVPYQEDLASVVRPRRPVIAGTPTTRRPAEERAAPLKLVAEQRIDVPAARPAQSDVAPVRPRRISVAELRATAEHPVAEPAPRVEGSKAVVVPEGGFGAFVEKVGASSLNEVLEAAAAYMSFVEGREEFSRPQLMTKAKQVDGQEFSREDGLRSFGMLLREGKIEKLKGGRFTVSERISFRPDARAAG